MFCGPIDDVATVWYEFSWFLSKYGSYEMTFRFAKPGEAFFNAMCIQLEWTDEQIDRQRRKHFPEEFSERDAAQEEKVFTAVDADEPKLTTD
jgi:hypothetical protein